MTVIKFPVNASPVARSGRCGVSTVGKDPLGTFIERAHSAVLDALSDPEPSSDCSVIAQLSGHFAAMRRVVYPAAARWLHADPWLPVACRARACEAEWALRLFECRLSGEARAVRLPAEPVRAALVLRLGSYRSVERMLLGRLRAEVPVRERGRIAGEYRAVLAAAPTRPHPRGPHTGSLGMLAFRFHSFWDRVLDTVDSRPGRLWP